MNDVIYQAMIPINPKTKKNNQQIYYRHDSGNKGVYQKSRGMLKYLGIPYISQSESYKRYEQDAGWFLRKIKTIDFPVNIEYHFYRENEIRCDLSNLIAAADDILVKYGIIADDNFKIVVGHDGSRVHVDRHRPRTEIKITYAEIQ